MFILLEEEFPFCKCFDDDVGIVVLQEFIVPDFFQKFQVIVDDERLAVIKGHVFTRL
jgi:hypothetical protein